MAYTVVLTPKPATGVIGAVQTFTAATAGAASAGTDSFVWTVDGVSQASTASLL
ncbi:hypothetical protein BN80_189 [Yersinia phage phiR1-RT]|uniref:Uncharacterized protein n=1 Tax=Yersinia phage phiR1-RT TaxID=1206558 RepID=I7LH88_BPPR1|nr:hypothetical protein BN80_189 [Yersinia phage phiR1-RT]CCI88759.1 hypothetical protein BN80_189 [Yersinia phage phiR1-RT]